MTSWIMLTSADAAALIPMLPRAFDALCKEPGSPIPAPIGTVGPSRIWDPLTFEAALPAIRRWIDPVVAQERANAKRAATIAERERLQAIAMARQEREMATAREFSERIAQRQAEADAKKTPAQLAADRESQRLSEDLQKRMQAAAVERLERQVQRAHAPAPEPKAVVLPAGMTPTSTPPNEISKPSDWTV